MAKTVLDNIRQSAAKERTRRIENGTWMPRGVVYVNKRKKALYNPKHRKDAFK